MTPALLPPSHPMTAEPIRFFLPGPVYVREEVRRAMIRPIVGHRGADFRRLYATLQPRLQPVFRTGGEVMAASGSATLVMESAVVSTVGSAVLNLTNGAFSERWHEVCRLHRLAADRVSAPWGEAVDPDLVRRALRRRAYDAVTVVHSETSTGVLNPLAEIAAAVRAESEALVLVDAVSSLGGARLESDDWGLDLVLAGSQKCLGLPPGITLFSLSERAARRAAKVSRRGFYTDLLRYRDKHRAGGPITTPAMPQFFALDRQLDRIAEEGIEARWRRHAALQAATEEWADAAGLEFASAAGSRSPAVSCLRPPPGLPATELVQRVAARGFTLAGGYGKWKGETFRIGHMGDVQPDDLRALLAALDAALGTEGPRRTREA